MTQIDIKVQNALTDIQGATEHFKNMSDKLFRNMTHIGNVKNEVNAKLNAMQSTLSSVESNFTNTSLQ